MKLVYEKNPTLIAETLPFDFSQDVVDPEELARGMLKTMLAKNGIGLAGPQVGVQLRVFVMGNDKVSFCCFNPKIIQSSDTLVLMQEGCLSFPNLYMSILRPDWIEVEYTSMLGDPRTQKFDGVVSRVFQHEFDHLDGILFTSKAKPVALRMGRQKQKKANKKTVYA